ncbi:MAG: aminotransferase class V-fold PLP-dependent enzyme [Bacillota bacterium]|nr:aminotransferase class V-fold PLP-dependent enzyme [Bacillota bacterium]
MNEGMSRIAPNGGSMLTVFEKARQEFPAATALTYVDISARNPMSNRVRAAIEAYLDDRQRSLDNKHLWFEKVERVRAKVASLLGAESDDITFTKNTSHGITSVIASLPWEAGDNAIITPDFEHPNNVYPWLPLRRCGVKIKTLPLEGPVVTLEQLERAADADTKAIGIASVSFATGGRVDLDGIAGFCKERGIFLMVDGVQSFGIMPLDVRRTPISALASATSKSLLGLYGLGVLYCRDAANLDPMQLSRFGVDLGDEHEYVQGDIAYKLAAGARRFDMGNYNYLAIHALDAGLDHILEIGVEQIQAHVLRLSGDLTEGLTHMGFQLVSSTNPSELSHVVVCAPPPGGASIPECSKLLNDNGIRHTIRRFGLRMSFHLYNNASDVERILTVLARVPGARS